MLATTLLLYSFLPAASPLGGEGVFSLPEAAFEAQVREDLGELRRLSGGLERLEESLKPRAALFAKGAGPLSRDERQFVLGAWAVLSDHMASVEQVRQRYWGFAAELPPGGLKHVLGFWVTHSALAVELAGGLAFSERSAGRPELEVLLDEGSLELGVAPRSFADLKLKVIHAGTAAQLLAGKLYRREAERALRKLGFAKDRDLEWARREAERSGRRAEGFLRRRGPSLFANNGLDIVRDATHEAIFPVQKEIAEWAGDARVRRIGRPLISSTQVDELLAKMEPGDVMVARQNWFLSNIGLPGFWPHAELFLGRPSVFSDYFDGDPHVIEYVKTLPGAYPNLSAFLSATYAGKWKAYEGVDQFFGKPVVIMESVSEGVSFTSADHGLRVDYLGVLRPRLSRLEKAKAIVRAFGYQGRPYDFDFDFYSDRTLVCTELVYKCYAPSEGSKGIRIDLVDIAGRKTLPANELVRLFDAEFGRPDRQFEFVAFLDGREEDRKAVWGDAESFRQSHRRVKWDVSQK